MNVMQQHIGSNMSEIEVAILNTVAYRDLFNFPATAEEIHQFLQGYSCDLTEVEDTLATSTSLRSKLVTDGEFYAARDREELFEIRRERSQTASEMWPIARVYAARLASLPFVRMVAVTGSLAANNPGRDADIDFMLITDRGRLWTVRWLAKILQLLDRLFANGDLCVNHLISMKALKLEGPCLYTAQELMQMIPLYGFDAYEQLLQQNEWVSGYLPNSVEARSAVEKVVPRWIRIRRCLQWTLGARAGDLFEKWESTRKLHKYNETDFLLGRATTFRPEATGHRRDARNVIESAFADRVRSHMNSRKNLRVLFGQAYHLHRDVKLWRSMRPFPPLGCLYAAAVAREIGCDVRVHDSMLSLSIDEWTIALQINRPDIVVLYEDNFNYLTKMCLSSMRDAAIEMIRHAKRAESTVLVCSSDSADAPMEYLQAGADFILVGEGEETLQDVIGLVSGELDSDPIDIAGIAFLSPQGELVQTPRRPVIRHIENLPLPAWDLIDLRRYEEIWTRRHGRFALNFVTTRGCPYHCNWCSKPIWGQRYNARSPQNVVDEISRVKAIVEIEDVWFMDDIFGLKPRWISEFASRLEAANISIRFKCLSRPDLILRDGETDALDRAGCDIVWMGAESGSQAVLDAMEKGTTVRDIKDASASLREKGIRVGLFIQFGYPGETTDDIQKTIKLIRTVLPDELGISVSYPLPGTPFYERVQAELGEARHWKDSDDLAMLFKGPYRTAFYRALHRYVHSDFGIRRAIQDRRFALMSYYAMRAGVFRVAMFVTALLPHQGIRSLPVRLSPSAAALPSEQADE